MTDSIFGLNEINNNAQIGMTLQKLICDKYGIVPNQWANAQFEASYNKSFADYFNPIIDGIFLKIGLKPIECLTFSPSSKARETLSPHNFLLEGNKTLSIRTNKSGDKVAPRVVGQCGIERFNEHFGAIANKTITDKQEIKEVVFNNIHLMLPIFIDYLFISDYTVWIHTTGNKIEFQIIDSNRIVNIELERNCFSFTKDLTSWNESTTVKYKGRSLAEIQIHKHRTFKFRFIMSELTELLEEQKNTSETLGITAEKTICDKFKLKYPENFLKRYSKQMQKELTPIIDSAFTILPDAIKHTGSDKGDRGGESKCSYDFVLKGEESLSLKTNTGKMVCPPEVGQPAASTCYLYFKDFVDEDHIDGNIYKKMIINKISEVFPIFIQHLFDSDFLLWIYKKGNQFEYKIFEKDFADGISFSSNQFSFTKPTVDDWIESNTLKYNGLSIGEFQVHKARDCYKFRFNLENFSNLIMELKNKK